MSAIVNFHPAKTYLTSQPISPLNQSTDTSNAFEDLINSFLKHRPALDIENPPEDKYRHEIFIKGLDHAFSQGHITRKNHQNYLSTLKEHNDHIMKQAFFIKKKRNWTFWNLCFKT